MVNYQKPKSFLFGATAPYLTTALVLLSVATNAIAAKPQEITRQEMALIPTYCQYAQGMNLHGRSREYKNWVARTGPGFTTIHHYCWGQINLLRALRSSTPQDQRKHLLSLVLGDYTYVINNSPPDFILLPEIYTEVGEVELRLGAFSDANISFAKARALKPDYWPAYSHWIEFLMQSGNNTEAMKVLTSGLKHSPNSRVLREQHRLLTGKSSGTNKQNKPLPDGSAREAEAPEAEKQADRTD
ncbi:MAG: hypothetical protein ABTR92_17940 [Candidatus Accumulibacter phosphatis]|jgi:tetratricopeptide (TPR) repeat protein